MNPILDGICDGKPQVKILQGESDTMKLTTCLNRDSAPYTGFSLAIFLALFLALPIFADKVLIYIANEAGDSIQVIDPTTQ